jgi:ribosome-binding protein aMBF1 (putative translation factor)
MDEKKLNKLLSKGMNRGEIAMELNDEIVDSLIAHPTGQVPDAAVARTTAKLRVRRQDEALTRAKRLVLEMRSLPFGRFIETVRERAGMTRIQIAWRLRKDEEYISRVERGDVSPLSMTAPDIADIVELLQVGFTIVSKMVAASVKVSESKHTYRAAARSHGGLRHDVRTEDVERAIDAFARKMQDKIAAKSPTSPDVAACLVRVRAELEKRGRKDLLV